MFGKFLGIIIGICVGLALDSVTLAAILAAAGFALGHLIDGRNAELTRSDFSLPEMPPSRASLDEAASSIQVRDLCALLIEVARSDSAVSRQEMRAIRTWLESAVPGQLAAVPGFLKAAIASPPEDVAMLAGRLRDAEGGPDRLELLEALYTLAEADGPLQPPEREALRKAAEGLGLDPRVRLEQEEDSFGDAAAHLSALGLPAEATNEEIKAAYRRLAREHHPDRAAHLGASAVEAASARFRAVHEAYEELKRRRGF